MINIFVIVYQQEAVRLWVDLEPKEAKFQALMLSYVVRRPACLLFEIMCVCVYICSTEKKSINFIYFQITLSCFHHNDQKSRTISHPVSP